MLRLKIVSPENVVFDGEAESVLVPGTSGSFEILAQHAPIISSLEKGMVVYMVNGVKQRLEIDGGFVEVKRDEVCLCVEACR